MPKVDWGLEATDPAFRKLSQGVWQIKTEGNMGITWFGWFTYDILGWHPPSPPAFGNDYIPGTALKRPGRV